MYVAFCSLRHASLCQLQATPDSRRGSNTWVTGTSVNSCQLPPYALIPSSSGRIRVKTGILKKKS